MESEKIIRAVLDLWDELPSLVGPDWANLYPRIEAILDRLREASESDRALAVADLKVAFQPYPTVHELLRERTATYRDWNPNSYDQGDGTRGADETGWRGFETEVEQRLDPTAVTRYTDVIAPRRLPLGHRRAVVVGLTRTPAADGGAEAKPLVVRTSQLLEVHLHSPSPDLEILGEPVRRLRVHADADTEPAVFYVKGSQPGDHRLVLDFRQSGASVGSLSILLEVVADERREEQQTLTAAPLDLGGPYVPPVDLDLRVTTEERDGRTALVYVLHSPSGVAGFHYLRIQGPTVFGSPEGYQARLLERMKELGTRRDGDQPLSRKQVEDRLQGIGHHLFNELFTGEMRTAYRRFRGKVRTLQITSEEPWIPWEIVKPFDDSDTDRLIDDDFLCVRFQMTRWLAGQVSPAARIRVGRLACIEASQAPGQRPLPFTLAERRYLASLAASPPGIENASPPTAGLDAVESLLDQGGVSLWHFATHGGIDLDRPDESGLVLTDGRKLRAEDLNGRRQVRAAQDRPLVFLNACRVGQQGWSLAGLGGWAAAWVERCRCGLFIGPLWAVNDEVAFTFAQCFYEALRCNRTVGQALTEAREQARKLSPADPTWLAYSAYAHPNARVTLPPAQAEAPQRGPTMRGG